MACKPYLTDRLRHGVTQFLCPWGIAYQSDVLGLFGPGVLLRAAFLQTHQRRVVFQAGVP